ncbi:MAG: glycosyltransferase [Lachnospiraceae bacterium]|nr:glycosyltransferase [Lachnospiraceae bacterium]
MPERYLDEISFVGSLYEKNLYDQIKELPTYLRGYLNGLMDAQKQLWGVDLVPSMLNPSLVEQLSKYIKIEYSKNSTYGNEIAFCNMLHAKITSEERISALNLLSDCFPVSLYSASRKELCPKANHKGIVSYINEMPNVFRYSKINLNITLRSITSGIPLRATDILACGGFLLTNYQSELCEFLEPGRDFVYFTDLEDMCHKADYYLDHEQERNEIAFCGWKKVQELFPYQKQVEKMLAALS